MTGASFAGVAGLVALIYLPMSAAPSTLKRTVLKTLPLSILTLAAFGSGAPFLLGLGLLLSALGDLFLSRAGKRAFLAGLVSFALAHMCYLLLFSAHISTLFWPGVAGLVALALSTEIWLSPHTGEMRWPVRLYILLISVMTALALSLPAELHLASLGAVSFLISDLILSLQMFRMKEGTRASGRAGDAIWCLYVAGQIALFLPFLPGPAASWGLF